MRAELSRAGLEDLSDRYRIARTRVAFPQEIYTLDEIAVLALPRVEESLRETGGVITGDRYEALARFGAEVGLAFQIQDDILDVEGSAARLGKTPGVDAARTKPTYATRAGLAGARLLAHAAHDRAVAALPPLGAAADVLAHLARYIVRREH